ncbi:MAG: UDP-N-acetylglucosamine pyrophosphorylase [Clostridia bacterium]|nr:UDP-N-acetylglucosamine pyrophosphorylase [Clostridia bacterium]
MATFPYAALWRDTEQHTLSFPLLQKAAYPWEILSALSDFIRTVGQQLPRDEYEQLTDGVWVARTAHIAPTAHVASPCIIGHDTEVRHGAFIRGGALVGDGAVVGNSTELKNCVLFDGVQVPHFNYVGDSVLGYRAHLGAGAITSNVKSDRSDIVVWIEQSRIPTGRRKLGAMVGDLVEVGCNSVLNPGCVVGRESRIYPCVSVRGYVVERGVLKGNGDVVRR